MVANADQNAQWNAYEIHETLADGLEDDAPRNDRSKPLCVKGRGFWARRGVTGRLGVALGSGPGALWTSGPSQSLGALFWFERRRIRATGARRGRVSRGQSALRGTDRSTI